MELRVVVSFLQSAKNLDIPVKLIGFGEKIDDIGVFNSGNLYERALEGLV